MDKNDPEPYRPDMEYTCEDCSNVYQSLKDLARHCKATGHYDLDVELMAE